MPPWSLIGRLPPGWDKRRLLRIEAVVLMVSPLTVACVR
jgi:hypothetical protein